MNYPQIWTEINLVEEYIPEGVMMSNRAFYMILVKASCEYLINLQIEEPKKEITKTGSLEEDGLPEIEFFE
jgi:hypothetical protein